jgi:hypothetical protein
MYVYIPHTTFPPKISPGLTARDLAMQCDFYKCADLLDELKEIMKKESEDRLRKSREQGTW